MLLDSLTLSRGRLAFHGWFVACVACTPPDGSVLFEPLALNGVGGSIMGSAGVSGGGAGGAGAVGVGAAGGASVVPSEGLGGTLSFAGAGGIAGESSGEIIEADAAVPDAGVVQEAPEAGPPPVVCEPAAERCDGLDNDCDELVDEGQTCADECIGFALADHGYMFCIEAVDRGIGLARCAAEDMKLVWLETPEENFTVVSTIADLTAGGGELLVQIGASDGDDEDEWVWIGNGAASDGFQFWEGNATDDADAAAVDNAYENWAEGEPNDTDGEDCGVLSVSGSENRDPGEWDDRNCDLELPFVCEVP
jgi:hypothetical protein